MKKFLILLSLLFSLSPLFSQNLYHSGIFDETEILTFDETQVLSNKIASIAVSYDCGIYIVVVPSLENKGLSSEESGKALIQSFSEQLYTTCYKEDAVILTVSIKERLFDIYSHGNFANYACTDYGKSRLEDNFVKDFKNQDYFRGFYSYVNMLEKILKDGRKGNPLDKNSKKNTDHPIMATIIGIITGLISSLTTCSIFKRGMKTVKPEKGAKDYIIKDEIKIIYAEETFTHSTQAKYDMGANARGGNQGGTSVNSGGFSHRSGGY